MYTSVIIAYIFFTINLVIFKSLYFTVPADSCICGVFQVFIFSLVAPLTHYNQLNI